MTLNKILKSVVRENLPNPGSGMYNAITSSSPMPTLLKPILGWSTMLRSRMQGYDAMALAMSNVPSAIDEIAGDQDKLESEISPTCFITEEEASILFSGLNEAKQVLAPTDPLLALTSSSGLVYNLQVRDNRIECITADLKAVPVLYFDEAQNQWVLLKRWPSTLELAPHEIESNVDMISILQRCCNYLSLNPQESNIQYLVHLVASNYLPDIQLDTIETMTQALCVYFELSTSLDIHHAWMLIEPLVYATSVPGRVLQGANESFISLMSSCVDTGTINGLFLECIDAIKSTKVESWISLQRQDEQDKRPCIRKILKRIATSYHQGGLKGVIYYLYQVIKGQSAITDDNGVLTFTDNSALLPREYIAGLVGQIISAIATVVGAIVSMVFQIVGVIVSIIGSIAWALFGSLKQDQSDTRASLPEFSMEDKSVNLVQYTPNSLLRGEINLDSESKPVSWYKDFYTNSGSCAVLDVPGGALFLGPGSFNQDGSIHTVRFEFHALSSVLTRWMCGRFYESMLYVDSNDRPLGFYPRNPDDIWEQWTKLINNNPFETITNDASTGHLSEDDDKRQYGSIAFCTLIFIYWLAMEENFNDLTIDNDHLLRVDQTASSCLATGFTYMWPDSPDALSSHWNDLVNYSTTMTGTSAIELMSLNIQVEGIWQRIQAIVISPTAPFMTSSLSHLTSEKYPATIRNRFNLNVGVPLPLPETPEYGVTLPRYNAGSFWTWIAVAMAMTAVVSVTTVVCATKFSKWCKKKRAENVAKFNDAQSTYQDAMSGVKTEVDPETGEIVQKQFDVNTPEGQAYIQSCYKSYRKTAFKNNMMAHIIGGTRYDTTTFYGDAEETDDSSSDSSILDDVSTLEDESMYGSDTVGTELASSNANLASVNLNPVISLIKG